MLIVVSSAITSQRKFFSSEHAWQAAVKTLGGHVLGRYEDQGGPGGARRGRHKSLETTDHQEEDEDHHKNKWQYDHEESRKGGRKETQYQVVGKNEADDNQSNEESGWLNWSSDQTREDEDELPHCGK
ncbi:hypothetical protein MJO28_015154 [Puccinia striiformis f. sp. tritici]|uniref:Uncharacterized protein n=4 Tax=Puccinia striiformis TaxID=27350 RepID=A0A0L0UQX3_9BASI|nr:hypothetical protein MJO29_014924 [Puccinia striiformis f. sp. tritici]KAI9607883.1 hypothetical protein H4Q26_005333 [Puccinia striiformis f. sp. tritici PST-130]KNE89169.1 hypothetical protein PSTG_17375 [Puccinia striiformis f. sp. tritici PST-78]POW08906.1 hypothetical protein PSTT_07207 [Puccinia striiformis]KAI7938234.1 hypothetical protein MJO28_015154 [Puccinia striiformis f. sp. tritici]